MVALGPLRDQQPKVNVSGEGIDAAHLASVSASAVGCSLGLDPFPGDVGETNEAPAPNMQ